MNHTPLSRRSFVATTAALLAPGAFAASPAPAVIADYERATGGRVGLFASNSATGRQLAWRAHERFVMCSTFKASLAGFVLARVDAGRERLDRRVAFGQADLQPYAPTAKAHLAEGAMTIATMCEAAVELSDNTCANLLLRELGGPAALTRFWRSVGDRTSRLDHDEPELNRSKPPNPQDTTTPAAMAHTIARLTTGDVLAPPSREQLVAWMVACQTGSKKLRAGLPPGWRAGDKTGNNGSDAAGDIAIAWPAGRGAIAIAAYVQGGKPTPQQQDALFAGLGQLVAERLA
jgi:beta-lactamase class A